MSDITCIACGKTTRRHSGIHLFCLSCGEANGIARARALAPVYRAVHRAVARGELRPAKDCKCVDCNGQAAVYEHRDYAKPLEVDPVCRGCNRRRGSAANNPHPVFDPRWRKPMPTSQAAA